MKAVAGSVVVAAVALGAGLYLVTRPDPKPAEPPVEETAAKTPKLYCQFYVFTEQRPRLALLFDVGAREGKPVFGQIYLAEDNGARTDYDGVREPRPEWRYDPAPEPKTIASTIMAPDTSQAGQHEQDITIELYGYDPARTPASGVEASLKNIHFQNLPGKCRQAMG